MKLRSSKERLRIGLITPARRSHLGNWVTAERWARILRRLGHEVSIRQEYTGLQETDGRCCDLLLTLHAKKSFASIEKFHHKHPARPLLLALTGTDLYRDIRLHEEARLAMAWADRIVLLQPEGREELTENLRDKARVIRQSAIPTRSLIPKTRRWFDVCVVGHLRAVKDPFRTAEAARRLPPTSRIRVVHGGGALSEEMARRARSEMATNPRYRWLGDLPRWQVRRLMAKSHVLVHSSEMEGGANVMSEAVVAGLPVVSTRISGSIGMLGADHPAYFEVGDTAGLTQLLLKCETDPVFLEHLAQRSRRLAPLFHPDRESEAWESLLSELHRS